MKILLIKYFYYSLSSENSVIAILCTDFNWFSRNNTFKINILYKTYFGFILNSENSSTAISHLNVYWLTRNCTLLNKHCKKIHMFNFVLILQNFFFHFNSLNNFNWSRRSNALHDEYFYTENIVLFLSKIQRICLFQLLAPVLIEHNVLVH